jgi:ribosome-associated protein
VDDVAVGPEGIRLGQLLKLAGLVDSGADAKGLLQSGAVQVNGEVDVRRGRQLRAGDVVRVGGRSVRVG